MGSGGKSSRGSREWRRWEFEPDRPDILYVAVCRYELTAGLGGFTSRWAVMAMDMALTVTVDVDVDVDVSYDVGLN